MEPSRLILPKDGRHEVRPCLQVKVFVEKKQLT